MRAVEKVAAGVVLQILVAAVDNGATLCEEGFHLVVGIGCRSDYAKIGIKLPRIDGFVDFDISSLSKCYQECFGMES